MSDAVRVVVIEPESFIRDLLVGWVDAQPFCEVVTAAESVSSIRDLVDYHRPDVVLLDSSAVSGSLDSLASAVAEVDPACRLVLLMSEHDRVPEQSPRHGVHGSVVPKGSPLSVILDAIAPPSMRPAARAPAEQTVEQAWTASLTDRENEVLGQLAEAMSNKEIASALSISPRTVERHVASILRKLRARNRSDVIRMRIARRDDHAD